MYHKYCDGGDIMIFIFHVTFRENMKGLCELMGGSPSR